MKKIALLLASTIVMMASDYTLDNTKSEAYYEAKKEQFWSTHIILATNKGLEGTLKEDGEALHGTLNIDVFKFDSDSSKRESSVEDHLHAKEYPVITYDYTIFNNQASGKMTVNGVTKVLTFPVQMNKTADTLSIDGNISIKFSDFNVETPNNLILSAHEDLIIGARLYFKK